MQRPSRSRRTRPQRRGLFAALTVSLVAALLPTMGAAPAGAQEADLVTEDGIGLRVDETALTGPVLDEAVMALQPFMIDMIRDGATEDGAPFDEHNAVEVDLDLQLDLAFSAPSTDRPDGGIDVLATIADIEIDYQMTGWFGLDCDIRIRPDDGTIGVGARVDRQNLPGTPIVLDPVQATWDDEPDPDWDWPCTGHVIWQAFIMWWDGLWDSSDPESTASRIERELNDTAQDLIDDLWDEQAAPVLDSLEAFGLTINQLRTDDHGLIVTADVDASNLTIPEIGGPFDVSDTVDSGADSDVNDLLAQRTNDAGDSHVIATVHPNVANQFLNALNQVFGGFIGSPSELGGIEEMLLLPEHRDLYDDDGWFVTMTVGQAPYTEPTGPGGAPQLRLPQTSIVVRHSSNPFTPVATFEGEMSGVDLVTEVRDGSTDWGPGFSTANATLSVTRTQANSHAVQVPEQDSGQILPYGQSAFDNFNESIFVQFLSLAPIEIGPLSVDLCPVGTCGRYPGDDRYTETFIIS